MARRRLDQTTPIHGLPIPSAARPRRSAILVQIYPTGSGCGRRFPLLLPEHVVGRLPELEVAIEEDEVSRRHARLIRGEGGWTLEDLGSTNGSFVNDVRVTSQALRDGDLVRFGGTILKFLAGDNVEAAYHEEIYRMTILDGLTGVHNKRYLIEFLEREMARARRYRSPLSLVMLDVDHFKRVNDVHGHVAGDTVLRDLGRRLRPRIRREDLLARYGGEEFACVLAATGADNARRFAENLRSLVAREPFAHEGLLLPVTISLGIAELAPSHQTADELIAAADKRLYEAKRAGRDQVAG